MKTSLRKRIAKEWLILLISIVVGFPLLVLVASVASSLVNPTSNWKELYLVAWWNRISQSELETFKNPEWEGRTVYLDKDHEKAIIDFENNFEKSSKFVQLSFLEKYQLRRKYFDNIYQDNQLIFIAEKELAGLTFHKVNMEGDISYIKSQNKWVEPSEGEDLKGSRLRWANMILSFERESLKSTKLEKIAFSIKLRWKDLWSLMGEGLRDSFGSLVLIALFPYFLSILLRSIVWAIKNR